MTVRTRHDAREVAAAVADPELPELTIADLGILRSVVDTGDRIVVTITPTYTGCPATEVMADAVTVALYDAGFTGVDVVVALSPPWTTESITPAGRVKLRQMGVAGPPSLRGGFEQAVNAPAQCPRCGSRRTRRVGSFGTSACREPFVCGACREPFERIKPI